MYGYLQNIKTNVSNAKRNRPKVITSLKSKRFSIGITSIPKEYWVSPPCNTIVLVGYFIMKPKQKQWWFTVRLKIFVIAEMKSFVFVRDGDITSVLIGASRPSQVLDNIGMIGNTSFSEEERRKIDEILESWKAFLKLGCRCHCNCYDQRGE